MNDSKRISGWLFGAVVVLFLSSGLNNANAQQARKQVFAERHMGTLFQITIAGEEEKAKLAAAKAFALAKELDDKFSDYKADSELMKLCDKAGQGPVAVSDELFAVLSEGQRIAKASDGAFDMTVGPIVRLWRLARRTREMPNADELKAALALVGYQKVKVDVEEKTIALRQPGMKLDLGGIAKGFAAQEMVKVLRANGCPSCLVAAGGDIFAGDAPPGEAGWSVAIAPLTPSDHPPTLTLVNSAVSTSGGAEQYVEIGGKRYTHIVDPKTGIGLTGEFAVTVMAKDGATCDALSKVAAVLGPERGVKLVQSLGGKARFVWKEKGKPLQISGTLDIEKK